MRALARSGEQARAGRCFGTTSGPSVDAIIACDRENATRPDALARGGMRQAQALLGYK